ncbi:MAG TPA: glycosyltransferase family 4 protein [Burkholderiales bacterium]|nr:glycosyltransferase family 4 protein [Burkholderiales bacterium]
MRLVFVTGSLVHGGAERHSITLANRLGERGHECRLVYVKNDPSQLERLRDAASAHCLHARRYLDRRALDALCALLARFRPGVLLAANPYAMLYGALALRRCGVPAALATTLHSTLLLNAKEWLQMLYYRPLFWSADSLVFVCEAQRRYWRRRMVASRSTRVIHNGVDLAHWQPAGHEESESVRRQLGYAAGDYVVGMCAVLRPEKNPLQLVDAIAALRARGVPARALFIGDGPMRAMVEARAAGAGVPGAVRITGLQQDVRGLLAACDVLVLCSDTEALSLAALEAMARGRPLVHSHVGGAAEMIRDGHNGFLYPVGDVPRLVERLAQLADPGVRSRMGDAARATVAERFTEQAMVERYENLFRELETTRSVREDARRAVGAR